jgi:accessory Sec system S-layer assembly protein
LFNFKKGNKKDTDAENQVTHADQYLSTEGSHEDQEEIETELSIPEDWNFSSEDRYVYAFHNSESPKLKKNQLSLYGTELTQNRNGLTAHGLVRSTVEQSVQFNETTILLLDANKQPIARKAFDLSQLGILPPNSARPFQFTFGPEDMILNVDENIHDWSLAFELKSEHRLDLEESWEKSIAEETKASLETIVKNAPALKPGEVNFMGLEAKQKDTGELVVTILIRNGADKHINLEQLPLGVKDANGQEVARGSFKLENFTVKANTSKPWSFIFPQAMVQEGDHDLSRWTVYVIQE